jgi:hypothetical protein
MDIVKFNKNSTILTEKYAPTNIDEIIGLNKSIHNIDSWIKNFNRNKKRYFLKKKIKEYSTKKKGRKKKKSDEINKTTEILEKLKIKESKFKGVYNSNCNLLVSGDHGCGKTAVVRGLLNGNGYKIKQLNFTKISKVNDIPSFIRNLMFGKNVYDMTCEQKYAIMVDEIESVSTPSEKRAIEYLLKNNRDTWRMPIIFIATRKHKKIINEVKKNSYNIFINEPTNKNMLDLLTFVSLKEKMKFHNKNIVEKIVLHAQNDYRRLLVCLQELKRNYNGLIINENYLNQYLTYSDVKDVDYTIFEDTTKLFSEYTGINGGLKIFENDKINMPLMSQQNHFMTLNKYIINKEDEFEIASKISESLLYGDIIENYIHSDQSWEFQSIHGYYSCTVPSFYITQNIDTEQLVKDSKDYIYDEKTDKMRAIYNPEYPKDLNRTSTRKINYKNVRAADKYFKNMEINDYIYCVKMIKNLLDDDRLEECKQMLSDYNIPEEGIKYAIKIDKINGTKKDISNEMEKKIKAISHIPTTISNIINNKTAKSNTEHNKKEKINNKTKKGRKKKL